MATSTVGLHPPYRSFVSNRCQPSHLHLHLHLHLQQLSFRRQRFSSGDLSLTLRGKGSGSSSAAAAAIFVCRSNNNNTDNDIIDDDDNVRRGRSTEKEPVGIQLYNDIERIIVETAKISTRSRGAAAGDWTEIEGAWILKPKQLRPTSIIHFIGGAFVGAAPQLTYRFFLECLSERGCLVIATPYACGFDHFFIADEVQYKFDRCIRFLQDSADSLPTFGVGHSLGSLIHLLIGSRYAVQRSGNILMSFNNKEASEAIPLFSPVIIPMAQGFGPLLSQLMSSPSIRSGAEMALKQLENVNPTLMKQVLPLVEQLSPLYMDLAKGREDFIPKPEETHRLIKSYYGVYRNLLVKFKDDSIDETPTLADVLSSDSAIGSMLDMTVRTLPGDHGLPLHQAFLDVPPAMADAINQGGELLSNLTTGTPWETMAKDVSSTLGANSIVGWPQISKDFDLLVDAVASWVSLNSSPRLLRS